MSLLTVRQDIQSEVQAHLDTQLADKPAGDWTVNEEFTSLYAGYTGSVLKEAMRLYNVIEFIPRRCTADTPVTDLASITKPSDAGVRTYLPFGLGRRACLGKSLGPIMMVGDLAAVFIKYSVELVAPLLVRREAGKIGAGEEWIKDRTYDWALRMLMDEVECNLLTELRKELPVRLVPCKPL
ncbi:MAG: hypothetical protein Q9216_004865 [Gyalolechia sp. 2 TL-2023]